MMLDSFPGCIAINEEWRKSTHSEVKMEKRMIFSTFVFLNGTRCKNLYFFIPLKLLLK